MIIFPGQGRNFGGVGGNEGRLDQLGLGNFLEDLRNQLTVTDILSRVETESFLDGKGDIPKIVSFGIEFTELHKTLH
jgi:hypothetical protein